MKIRWNIALIGVGALLVWKSFDYTVPPFPLPISPPDARYRLPSPSDGMFVYVSDGSAQMSGTVTTDCHVINPDSWPHMACWPSSERRLR